jgi:hypothetical protein
MECRSNVLLGRLLCDESDTQGSTHRLEPLPKLFRFGLGFFAPVEHTVDKDERV